MYSKSETYKAPLGDRATSPRYQISKAIAWFFSAFHRVPPVLPENDTLSDTNFFRPVADPHAETISSRLYGEKTTTIDVHKALQEVSEKAADFTNTIHRPAELVDTIEAWDAVTKIDSSPGNSLRRYSHADTVYSGLPVSLIDRTEEYSGWSKISDSVPDRTSKQSTTYIVVKSKALRDTLASMNKNVVNVKAPIRETDLYHFLPDLECKLEEMVSNTDLFPTSYHHLDLLIRHLKKTYSSTAETLRSLLNCGETTYEHLVMLFKPGCKVFSKCFGSHEDRCVVFVDSEERTRNDQTYFTIKCQYLDHDGEQFGDVDIELGIAKFSGCKMIHTLEAFPLQYHPDYDRIVKDLLERGRKFVMLTRRQENRPVVQQCTGTAFTTIHRKLRKIFINSRVAVDPCFFHKMDPNYRRPDTFEWEACEYGREEATLRRNSKTESSLTDDDLLTSCPTVLCYSFEQGEFLECPTGGMEDVQWSSAAFDSLQMDNERKDDLLSVVAHSQRCCEQAGFDDFIPGKGKGCIILFSGPPGVGKTFSVEAIAEKIETPLLPISIGDLGAGHGESWQLQHTLDRKFQIAEHFNAILLLDEADVFIEKRLSYQDNHNHIVGVFLRTLEYFNGILFMTTNREAGLDEGIMSRLYLQMKFPELTEGARQRILEAFLSKIPNASISNQDLAQLASEKLDGREIRNLVSYACKIAGSKGEPVTLETLQRAMRLNDKYSERSTARVANFYT